MIPAGKSFTVVFLMVCVSGLLLYRKVFLQYLRFLLPNAGLILLFLSIGFLLSFVIIAFVNSPSYLKGRAHNKGIYILTVLVKTISLALTVFYLSISMWNVINTSHMAVNAYNYSGRTQSESDYVTFYVSDNNGTFDDDAEAGYLNFYKKTVVRFHGVLINSGNYTYVYGTDQNMAEIYDQDFIEINRNYLGLNPVIDVNGNMITSDMLSEENFNILVPASKTEKIEKYREHILNSYSADPSFIIYDDLNSEIYSYSLEVLSKNGLIDSPFILIIDENHLSGSAVEAYCSTGYYFLTALSDEHEALDAILQETGIAKFISNTPTMAERYQATIKDNLYGLVIYGLQSLSSLGLLIYLIIFSTQVYFTNHRKKISYKLISGYSRLSTIKIHLLLILITHVIAYAGASYLADMSDISIIIPLAVFAVMTELVIVYISSVRLSKSSINKVIKGEE